MKYFDISIPDPSGERQRGIDRALDAVRSLVLAYVDGEGAGGSVAWEDLDQAEALAHDACEILFPEWLAQLEKLRNK